MTTESLERLGFLHSVKDGQDCYIHSSEMKEYINDTHPVYRLVLTKERVVVTIGDQSHGILLTILDDIDEIKAFWYLTHKQELIEV